jgi:hypothetical protein
MIYLLTKSMNILHILKCIILHLYNKINEYLILFFYTKGKKNHFYKFAIIEEKYKTKIKKYFGVIVDFMFILMFPLKSL